MQLHFTRYISITGVGQMKFKLDNPFKTKICGTDLHRTYNFLLDQRIFIWIQTNVILCLTFPLSNECVIG